MPGTQKFLGQNHFYSINAACNAMQYNTLLCNTILQDPICEAVTTFGVRSFLVEVCWFNQYSRLRSTAL